MIYAIQGKKNSGKDTCATYLQYLLNTPKCFHFYWLAKLVNFKSPIKKWTVTRYAGKLKEMVATLINVPVEWLEDREFKENWYFDFNNYRLNDNNVVPNYRPISDKTFTKELKKGNLYLAVENNLTIRQLLQFFGTDIMRRYFGDKLWIFTTLNGSDNVVIADQRFFTENEVVRTTKNAITLHIIRDCASGGLHSSEKELDDLYNQHCYDTVIDNNGTLKDLFNNLKRYLYGRE